MSGIKTIGITFPRIRETTHSTIFPQIHKSALASGKNLVCIRLMSDIPDNLIYRRVKGQVQCHRKFHNTQIRGKMSSGSCNAFHQKLPDLRTQGFQFFFIQFFYVIDIFYLI